MLPLRAQIEIWHRYGAYLSGITSIAAERPDLTFDQLYTAIGASSSFGMWGKEALRNAFNAGRKTCKPTT